MTSVRDTARAPGSIALLLDWIDALRSADLDRIRTLLDPQVTWRGLTDELAQGRIREIRDFAARKDAFRAAGLDREDEWR